MRTTIWKFPLNIGKIGMPLGAQILHVHEQSGIPCIWAAVDPDQTKVIRKFNVVPTGGDNYKETDDYLGTVHMQSGLVFHIFEDKH